MRRIALTLVAATLACASTHAADVFVTRDSQGRPIYTDRPESLPAQKVRVANQATDDAMVAQRYQEQMKSYAEDDKAAEDAAKATADQKQARQLTADDKARRCTEARERYQKMMDARRLYEPGSTPDERRYLDAAETDAARANARKVMDDFCAGR
jgi:hypothetical protein